MAYRPVGRRATHLALLLGSAFFTVATPVAAVATVAAEAPSLLPPGLMLAKNWQAGVDPLDFLVSEKLDGVRAFWDGHTLRFRSGRRIATPDWFMAALPSTPLDGELWLGRGSFDRLSSIVRRSIPVDAEWRELRYMIFDLPGARAAALANVPPVLCPWWGRPISRGCRRSSSSACRVAPRCNVSCSSWSVMAEKA